MLRKILSLIFVIFIIGSSFVIAQAPDFSQLDPKPYDPETEPLIDMFIANYKESMPRHIFGSLIERDILTPNDGDPMRPASKGAVLTDIKGLSHGTLQPHASTIPSSLKDEQKIFYIYSGKGTLKTGQKTADLYNGIGVLMPPGIEFTMINTGDESLMMYLITEPVPSGFQPPKEMVVKDENVQPISVHNAHWSYVVKKLLWNDEGLSTLLGIGPVWVDPMNMGQPHSHDTEEIWIALEGDINILLGKQIRKFSVGSAYKVPQNGITPHSNINVTDERIKLLWFMK